MGKYRMLVWSSPVEGRESEFNQWYDGQHAPDVLKVPGVLSAQRYRVVGDGPARYLAAYELECDDPLVLGAEIRQRAGSDAMPISPAIDRSSVEIVFVEPVSGKILA